jgi:hypothetical protein
MFVLFVSWQTLDRDAQCSVLRSSCERQLPTHMVPSFFAFLPRLPLLSAGKVDRKALRDVPTDSWFRDDSSRQVELPQNALERQIAAVVSSVLQRSLESLDVCRSWLADYGASSLDFARMVRVCVVFVSSHACVVTLNVVLARHVIRFRCCVTPLAWPVCRCGTCSRRAVSARWQSLLHHQYHRQSCSRT